VGETTARAAHEWLKVLHSGSELPSYDVHYHLRILRVSVSVTLSVHKDYSRQFVARLMNMVKVGAFINVYKDCLIAV
jgi:hypothetical protein